MGGDPVNRVDPWGLVAEPGTCDENGCTAEIPKRRRVNSFWFSGFCLDGGCYSLANAFHLPSLSYAIETTNQESCSTSYSGVAVPVPPGGLPWSQLGSRLNTLAGRLLTPLAILTALQPGVDNSPKHPLYRSVSDAELQDILATGQFRTVAGGMEAKQFFQDYQSALVFNSSRFGGGNIVTTRVRQSTLQQGHVLPLTSGESSAAVPALSFEPSGLAAVNADATVTGIQVLQGGCE